MGNLILVCGSTGAGKTTYSIKQASETAAVRFSIDPWMRALFLKDMKELDYSWISERVERCHAVIWDASSQILALDGNVILDLGFGTRAQRDNFRSKATGIAVQAQLHYIDTPLDERKSRVKQRNIDKNPDLYSFEVSDFMFDFMEKRFQEPDEKELVNGIRVSS